MGKVRADLALIWLDEDYRKPDIIRLDLACDVIQAVVPSNHPLAKKKQIHIRDLEHEPFIAQPRHAGTQRYECIMQSFATISAEPRTVYEALQMPLVMSMVAAGQGVSLLPAFLSKIPMAGIVFRPLVLPRKNSPTMTYNLIAASNNSNPATDHFLETARAWIKAKK